MLLGHYFLFRGDSRRRIELSELAAQLWPPSEGPSACHVFVVQSSKSKTNQTGAKYYMGAMRHKDPMLCSMGALAQYLVWRWHFSGEPAPDFRSRSSWYRLKLLVGGEGPTEELSYTTQYDCCLACFQEASVTTESVTHCMRGSGARLAESLGVAEGQVSCCSVSLILQLANLFFYLTDFTWRPVGP
jgi:hypothetical protein